MLAALQPSVCRQGPYNKKALQEELHTAQSLCWMSWRGCEAWHTLVCYCAGRCRRVIRQDLSFGSGIWHM